MNSQSSLRTITPAKGKVAAYHAAKHRVFLQMHKHHVRLGDMMRAAQVQA